MLKKHSSKKLPVRVFLLVLLGTLLWILAGFNYASVTHAQTIPPTCNDSLQAKINAAPSGGTVTLTQSCIYREQVTVNKPLTIDGTGVAEIRGSDVWNSGWSQNGSVWTHSGAPTWSNTSGWCEDNGRCQWPHQVFINGQNLYQVASNPGLGQFSYANGVITIGENPSGKTIEVTTRQYWLLARSHNVTVKNITMMHAGNPNMAPQGAINSYNVNNFTIENSKFSYAHLNNVVFTGGSGHKLLNSDVGYGGHGGAGTSETSDVLFRGNKLHHGNTEDFAIGDSAGNKSANLFRMTVDNNEIYENNGPGYWCDINCIDIVISNNRVWNNEGEGIFFEISSGAKIFGNKVWNNGGSRAWCYQNGILISSSSNAEVYNNTVAWNTAGISVLSQNRADANNPQWSTPVNNYVHDNTIINDRNQTALSWCQDFAGTLESSASNNRGANNKYWYPDTEGSYQRFGAQNRGIWKLSEFNATLGEENGEYISNSEKDAELLSANMPLTPDGPLPSQTVPSTTPTDQPSPTPPVLRSADINNDGSVTIADIMLAVRSWFSSGTCSEYICDVYVDGKVNALDFVHVVKNSVLPTHSTPPTLPPTATPSPATPIPTQTQGARTFSVFSVDSTNKRTLLNGQPFRVIGLRASNALITDDATNELISNMDTFKSYGVNTISVFFQGSRFGNIKGYNEDTSLNLLYANRMKRIIEEADKRKMVILVGVLYYGTSTAKWSSWGQNQANQAVANTVQWLKNNNFRNVFIDVDNEHMSGFDNEAMIQAGKAIDNTYKLGAGGMSTPPPSADLSLHWGSWNVPGKPYIESEGVPNDSYYWGDYSKDGSDNYINVGIYTTDLANGWKNEFSTIYNAGHGYMGASTWLQAVPPKGPNLRPGGLGTSSDPGIRFFLEHIKSIVGAYNP